MNNWELVETIWGLSDGGFGAIATIDRVRDRFFETVVPRHQLKNFPHEHADGDLLGGYDRYFSALTFTEQRRGNTTVARNKRLLFADLDRAEQPYALDPQILWETSPGSFQGVWILQDPIRDYVEWASLNQRLTYYLGADRGGWMGSKLLRVPGSLNWKRAVSDHVPLGIIHRVNTDGFWENSFVKEVLSDVTLVRQVTNVTGSAPDLVDGMVANEIMHEYWKVLRPRTKAQLMQSAVRDRSVHAYKVVRLLNEDGIPAEDAFHILHHRPWNKWVNRPDELWREVSQAYGPGALLD